MQSNGAPDTQELEAGFNALSIEPEGFASTKKIWGVEDKHVDDAKPLFISDSHQWGRDSTWSSAPGSGNATNENGGLSDHAVSQPIMVKRGNANNSNYSADGVLLSPRSNDTGFIGMKMAESLLNNSPSSKENLESRLHSRLLRDHDKVSQSTRGGKVEKDTPNSSHPTTNGATNGFGPNEDGIDPTKIFNRAPGIPHQIDESVPIISNNKTSVIDGMIMPGHPPPFSDFNSDQLTSGAISAIDALPPFGNSDYVNHLLPSANDSPNLMEAYTNNLYQQQQRAAASGPNSAGQQAANNQLSLLASQQQQHLSMTAQQNLPPNGAAPALGHPNAPPAGNTNIFPAATQSAPNHYFSDPFMSHMLATGAPGPAAMAMASQYYGFPPWNMYPGLMPNATTAGGQLPNQSGHPPSMQQVRGGNNPQNSSGRPMSPTGGNDHNSASSQALAAIQAQAAAAQAGQTGFPMIPMPGAPSGFYADQNSLSALAAAGRGMPPSAMHRMMPPQMNMLQNPAAAIGSGNLRMLQNAANQAAGPSHTQANPLFAGNGPNNANANAMYTSGNSALGYNNMPSGIFSANGHPTGPQALGPQQMGFHNPGKYFEGALKFNYHVVCVVSLLALGPIGASLQSGMANNALGGTNSPRRDSMDGRNASAVGLGGVFPNMINESNMNAFSRHMAASTLNNAVSGKPGLNNNLANAQFYGMGINSPGPMGMAGMTGQSMTPPPMNSMEASMNGFANALTGPNNSLYMNGMRLMNPGSEGKYMARNGIISQNAAFAAGIGNFGTASSQVMNNQAGMHFNHPNGMQQVNNQTSNNYSSNSSNRTSTQRT